uniref:cell division protein ZapE n=1 Tax=Saccharothrix mutabilis TaxID=33921 RepID=UPI0031CEC044
MRARQLLDRFHDCARDRGYTLDAAQEHAAARLAELGAELTALFGGRPRGVYLWGPVGRGKSWLADTFFDLVPLRRKRRVHFHEFFRELHTRISAHLHEPGAVEQAVAELTGNCRLLHFDEFHLHDVGDAMLVLRLLESLRARGVVLLVTSNYPPSGLLPNPLYHDHFLPGIALVEASMDVVEVAGPRDYRRTPAGAPRSVFETGVWCSPGTDAQLAALGLARPSGWVALPVNGREVRARAARDAVVWFDFADLCERPTSTRDYLVLAERYRTWVLDRVPPLATRDREARQRFANVVDVLVDRDVRLVLVGEADLLAGDAQALDRARTASRLALLQRPGRENRFRLDGVSI